MSVSEPATDLRRRFRLGLKHRFGIDTRALAVLRIGMGLVILVDLFYRAVNLRAFYTDQGVMPRSALMTLRPYYHDLSLHALSGELWLQVVLFAALGIAAAALTIGYRTRIATVASFVLMASMYARNPYVLNSGDSLLLLLVLWGAFLPLGARYSLDARRGAEPPRRVADVATAAILIQVVLIYSMNAYFKFESGNWTNGEAMLYTFNIDRFSTPLGLLLSHAPPLLVALGWLWLGMVTVSGLLIVATGRTRIVLVALFALVHFGMLLLMRLGVFPLVSMVALLPFLPTRFWNAFEARIVAPLTRIGPFRPPTRNADGASPMGRHKDNTSLWLRMGRPARTPAVAIMLVLLCAWSAFSLGVVALPDDAQKTLEPHQRGWAMFANPSRDNVWYVAPAILETGATVDALHGDETPWAEPVHDDSPYPDIRWRKYLAGFHRLDEKAALPEHFAAYLCHEWNSEHETRMLELTIHRLEREIRLDGPDPPPTKNELIARSC